MLTIAMGLVIAGCGEAAERETQTLYLMRADPEDGRECLMLLPQEPFAGSVEFHRAWLGGGCESAFPFLMVLSGWEPSEDGGIRLIGAEGSQLMSFRPEATGGFSGTSPAAEGGFTLRRVNAS